MAKSSFFSGTGTTSNDVDSVTSSKAAAAASATNAATSETNAAASASSASTSATNASTSATNASNSATAAATSETNAASSETSASTSATNAATSETNAATSATNAATSETNAATSATNAATSEANASTSATAAATSAASVVTQASDAAASAAAAATSETNAATSETNAATSETNAATSKTNAATSETNAAASATSASTDAATASTAATNASTSATNAATSATNAATSATAAAASQTAAAASAASAATAYDTFDDRYLGSKTADPTVDNDGNALVAGALYFNSSANEMRVYDGANWIAATSAGNASLLEYKYTATSGQTTFSGADDSSNTLSYTQDNLIVTLNGVMLENGTDYTATTGTSVVLTSGAAANDELNVIAFKSFTTADMVSSANGGTFYNDINVQGNITADGLTVDKTDTATYSSTSVDDTLVITRKNSSGTNNQVVGIEFDVTQASGVTTGVAGISAVQPTNASSADLVFQTRNSGTIGERLRIDSTGNVGLGTTSPDVKLHVSDGALRVAGTETAGSFLNIAASNTGSDGVNILASYYGLGSYGPIKLWTGGSERMRIDSSGNVGIGNTNPSDYNVNGNNLVVGATSGNNGITISTASTGFGTIYFADGTSGVQQYRGMVQYDHGADSMTFRTLSAERMRIHSSGRISVNTTTDNGSMIEVVQDTDGYPKGFRASSQASPTTYTALSMVNGTDAALTAGSSSSVNTNLTFYTASSGTEAERMRIDSSGRLYVGTTDNTIYNDAANEYGFVVEPSGEMQLSADNRPLMYLNRQNGDGGIIDFRKDGSTVGSIGTSGGDLNIGTGDTALGFADGLDAIIPMTTTGNTVRDNAIDIGSSIYRFKDLYLSGGVYLGGTGSANKLDDYEEGVFQSSLTPSTSGTITLLTSYDVLSYTKVGRAVTVTGDLVITSTSSPVGTSVQLALPFTIGNLSELSGRIGGAVSLYDASVARTTKAYVGIEGNSYISVIVDPNALTTSDSITISLTYFTA